MKVIRGKIFLNDFFRVRLGYPYKEILLIQPTMKEECNGKENNRFLWFLEIPDNIRPYRFRHDWFGAGRVRWWGYLLV